MADAKISELAALTTPVDADLVPVVDVSDTSMAASGTNVKVTWANIKATLKTYFDTLYNNYVHPNHSGDVTSVADGATTIANDAVTYAKMQNVSASDKLLGRVSTGAGDVEEVTFTDFAQSILDDADEATFKATVNLEIGTDVQAYNADLTSLATNWVQASAAGASSLDFHEDTDNGSNKVTLKAPASVASDKTITFPDETGTILTSASGQPLDATLTALAAYSTNGIVTQTSADTFAGRTITGTSNEVTVTNGDGVSGNPTLSLPATIDLGGKTSFEVPNSAAPTVDADGEIAVDTTVTDFSHGVLKYFGGEEMGVVAMPIAQFTSPTGDYVVKYNATADEFQLAADATAAGGEVSDGDKGDITVSSTGTVWTIDNDVVTYAKMQNVSATDKLLGRVSASAGDVEEITFTDFAQSILDDADEATFKATVNLEIGTDVQAYSADLTSLATNWVQASAAGASSLDFHEDTDNGTNKITLTAPASVASDKTVTFQDVTGTVYVSGGTDIPVTDGGTGASTAADALINLGLTAIAAELNILDGATLTVTELNYVDGVTSAIQTQIDGKQAADADLTTLSTAFSSASASGPASLALHEDTDNGTNKVTIIAPSSVATDKTATLQDVTGTIYVSSGTDVALADGGTGASLTDPNADRIMFWDDSAGAVTWLTAGTGLTITTTTIAPDAASTTASGIVELAIASELNTGTDATRAVTPDSLAGSNLGIRYVSVTLNGTTALTTSEKAYYRIPAALTGMNLVSVTGAVGTGAAGSSSSGTPTFTVKNVTDNNQMLSTSLTIDASEYTSATAAVAAVINTSFDDVATDDLIEVACTTSGTGVTYATITMGFQLP